MLVIGFGATAVFAMVGCGAAVTKAPDGATAVPLMAAASPARPAVPRPAITEPFSQQPTVSRLATVANYPSIGIALDPANPQLIPLISVADAYTRCQQCPHGTSVQGFGQQLAYFSADTPATIPSVCVPHGVPMPSICANPPTVPIYQHRLAWVFTWYSECMAVGPVQSSPPPTPFTCLNVVPFDATTGDESYTFSSSA